MPESFYWKEERNASMAGNLAFLAELTTSSSLNGPLSGCWAQAVVCSALVGLSGVLPVALLPLGAASEARQRFMLR